jgi:hypothetical protein
MKKKKAANEASRMTTTGMTIAGMRVLVFELDDLWALAPELVALAVAVAVALMVALEDVAVSKALAADKEDNSAELVTMTRFPWLCLYVVPEETKVVVL